MNHLQFIKILFYVIGFLGTIARFIEPLYVVFYKKPLFVHLYFVKKKLPKKERKFLINHVSFYKKLNKKHKIYFEHRVAMFLRTYKFVSRGQKITPQIRVLIACSYVKLTFGMRHYLTSIFNNIIVYPTAFYSSSNDAFHKGEFNPLLKTIVFSWEDFLYGDLVTNDNLNLGIHEFAHVLTFHGKTSGDVSAGIFYDMFTGIATFVEENIDEISEKLYFRDYAYENKLEFIAVLLEHFFESPREFENRFPDLYQKVLAMLNYRRIVSYIK